MIKQGNTSKALPEALTIVTQNVFGIVNKVSTDKIDVGVSRFLNENKFYIAENVKTDIFGETFFNGNHFE